MTQCQQSLFWKMLLSLLLLAYLLEKETPEVQLYFFSIMKNHNKEPMHEGWFYKPSYGQDIFRAQLSLGLFSPKLSSYIRRHVLNFVNWNKEYLHIMRRYTFDFEHRYLEKIVHILRSFQLFLSPLLKRWKLSVSWHIQNNCYKVTQGFLMLAKCQPP